MNNGDMDNLVFKYHPLKFLPEDEEKMKNMTVKEKIEFIKEIRANQRYTVDYGNDKG